MIDLDPIDYLCGEWDGISALNIIAAWVGIPWALWHVLHCIF